MIIARTALCRFRPDLRSGDRTYDFAVIGASRTGLAFWTAELSVYGLKFDIPVIANVIEHTAEALEQRVKSVIDTGNATSGLETFGMLLENRWSAIQFAPLRELETPLSLDEVVLAEFHREVLPAIDRHRKTSPPADRVAPRPTEPADSVCLSFRAFLHPVDLPSDYAHT